MAIARIPAVLLAALALFGCSKAPEPPPAARSDAAPVASPSPQAVQAEHAIAWETGDVDAAFAKAKAEG